MAEAAGLALGVLGVTALFSTCVEAFDVVVSARECSKEYEELSALLGLQRLRFEIWGESVGLPSGRFNNEHKIPYNTQLDLPQVRPDIERALENIRQLLDGVTALDGRYGPTPITGPAEVTTTLKGTQIFQSSFDRLKKRIRKNQEEKSIRKITRWALHDCTQFKETILRLTAFVDGLYQVTTSLGLLQSHYEALRIHEEINAITKEEDLELLAEAASKHSNSSIHQTVSDAASRRLSIVSASIREIDIESQNKSRPHSNASTYSFHTAKTRPSKIGLQAVTEEASDTGSESGESLSSSIKSNLESSLDTRSCAECEDASLKCSIYEGSNSCTNCMDFDKECSFDLSGSLTFSTYDNPFARPVESIPQHERLLTEAAARSRAAPRALSFQAGDDHHGERMTAINDGNLDYWIEHGASLVYQAHRSSSVAKRMFHELKIIRKAKVPFISATPVGDDLGRILASIEGPPETPYEGGIFWILVSASKKTPPGAPTIRFHTKIYHPNIDHRTGVLCADYEQKWSPAKTPASLRGHFAESNALWSERTSPDMWSLLALLIAICGLLASPNASDPLVPEIAQKFVEDPDGYFEAAKMWTEKYASDAQKPDESSLRFPDDLPTIKEATKAELLAPTPDSDDLPTTIQQYLRTTYDEKFINDWVPISATVWHSSTLASDPNALTINLPDESENTLSCVEQIVDYLLTRDAQESHLRQRMDDCLSKIEQWRMVRELRMALEMFSHQTQVTPVSNTISSLGLLTKPRIRRLIGESASRQKGATSQEKQYFDTLRKSFPTNKTRSQYQRLNGVRATRCSTRIVESTPLSKNSDVEGHSGDYSPRTTGKSTRPSPTIDYTSFNTWVQPYPQPFSSKSFTYIKEPTPVTPSPRFKYNEYKPTSNAAGRRSYGFGASSPRHSYTDYYSAATGRSNEDDPPYTGPRGKRQAYISPYQVPKSDPDFDQEEYSYYKVHNFQIKPGNQYYEEPVRPQRRPSSSAAPRQPTTRISKVTETKLPLKPTATDADARAHNIPPGYALKHWDPDEQPILLLGSVFDANTLGKWIFDWTVYRHGPSTPISEIAGDLWLLLIQLAGKIKRAEDSMPRIVSSEDRDMVEDFIESGERLMDKLRKLLKNCEGPMLKSKPLNKNAGIEFVNTIFGRDRELAQTEKFMTSLRLWNMRFDANCEDILRGVQKGPEKRLQKGPQKGSTLIMDRISIRTAFGLEDISEDLIS